MRSIGKGFTAGVFLLSTLVTSSVQAAISQLVIFGDSLADAGNNALLVDSGQFPGFSPGARTATPIPNSAFIPTVPYSSNRYSNGPVWTEQFASAVGSSATPSLAGGNDYAFGGARSGPSSSAAPSVLTQVGMFLGKGAAPANALYVIQAGGNDAFDALDVAAGGGNPTSLISDYATNIASAITQLKGAGAHDFLIADVTDIGLVPAVQAAGPVAAGAATQIATELNTALFTALAAVDTPGTNIHLLDLFGGLHQVHDNPAAFGITKFTSACAADTSCIADPNGAFFWDGIHTTTMGDSIIAAAALAAVPEPSIVWLMLLGVAGLGLWRCRAGICQSIRTFLSSS